jgi:predicted phosphodiesterase
LRTAIISDIHGNLEALQAVLKDIEKQRVDRIICLGDVIGYGPNPRECLDLVMKMQVCVIGNHDYGAVNDPEGFSAAAERAIFWTRQQVERSDDPEDARRRIQFLMKLPRIYTEDKVLYVHGSIRNPINEYVFPDDIYNRRKMERLFMMIETYCFQGHTHHPGIFTPDYSFLPPDSFHYKYRLTEPKAMINVGSVGQPRDEDCRSCYVIYEPPNVEFRRIEYDIDVTANKIFAISDLDPFLGERLYRGN